MKCPECGEKLPDYVLNPDADFNRCHNCHKAISIKNMKHLAEPEDCPLVQEGEYEANGFEFEDTCQDCYASCIFAREGYDFDLNQDEEGNWIYSEDLDE